MEFSSLLLNPLGKLVQDDLLHCSHDVRLGPQARYYIHYITEGTGMDLERRERNDVLCDDIR